MLSERALINASKTLSLGIRCVHGLLQIRFFHVFFLSCASGMTYYGYTYYKLPAVVETSSAFVHFDISKSKI